VSTRRCPSVGHIKSSRRPEKLRCDDDVNTNRASRSRRRPPTPHAAVTSRHFADGDRDVTCCNGACCCRNALSLSDVQTNELTRIKMATKIFGMPSSSQYSGHCRGTHWSRFFNRSHDCLQQRYFRLSEQLSLNAIKCGRQLYRRMSVGRFQLSKRVNTQSLV